MSVNIHISVVSDGTPKYIGFRGLHILEGGRVPEAPKMPAVIPPIDQIALRMTREIQWMSYLLMQHFCPTLTPQIWTGVHKWDTAMNNGKQNGYDGGYPLRNYPKNENLDSDYWPSYDKMQRTFEGTFIRGELVGDRIICRPGIHGIDARAPLPTVETIVKNNWYVVAVNTGPDSNPGNVSHFSQGGEYPIVYPFIFDRDIAFPAAFFGEWRSNELPNPVQIYTPLP